MRRIRIVLYIFTLFYFINAANIYAQNKTDNVVVIFSDTVTGIFSTLENYGLYSENVISYRSSSNSIKMPQIAGIGNITLFNGKFANCNAFWTFYNNINMDTILRERITVQYYEKNEKKILVLNNAWPTKIEGISVDSSGHVLVSGMEISYENIIKND